MKLLLYSLQGLLWQQMNAAGNLITFLSAPVPFTRQCRSQQHFLLILQVAQKMSNSPPEGLTRAVHLSHETLFKYLEGSLMVFSPASPIPCTFPPSFQESCCTAALSVPLGSPRLYNIPRGWTTYLEAESGQKLSAPPAHPTGRGGDKKPVKVGVVHPAGESMENAAVSPSRVCPSCLGCGLKNQRSLDCINGKKRWGVEVRKVPFSLWSWTVQ